MLDGFEWIATAFLLVVVYFAFRLARHLRSRGAHKKMERMYGKDWKK